MASAVWGTALAAGRSRRTVDTRLDVVAGGLLAIGDDVAGLRDSARASIALYVGGMGARDRNFYNDLMRRYGYEAEARTIQDLYLAGRKDEAAAAVPAEFLELSSLVGPAGHVKERVEAYREAGVTMLNVTPVGPDPVADVRTVREWLG
jgi:alkanesulfonate monooxygenase SsuD/methylene tetrahydromethanopterin reductase-like flavin-dependent oxidoreductase (luciferase family)